MSTFTKALEQRDDPKEHLKAFDFNRAAASKVRVTPPRQVTPPKP